MEPTGTAEIVEESPLRRRSRDRSIRPLVADCRRLATVNACGVGAPGNLGTSALKRGEAYAGSQAIDGPSFSFATAIVAMSGSATPFFTAVTSARMDTAISGGVRLPM